jgi:D-arabinose 1-dehydrogenase-like Zn-dependent alcohol dehydrogenase
VLEVKGAGTCRTDISMPDGTITEALAFKPITLGHDLAGPTRTVGEASRTSSG